MQNNNETSRLAWLKLGLKTIDNEGLGQLKINSLCKKLQVTKGSFYHWFKSKNDYEMQVLEFWKLRFTQNFIDLAESGKTNKEKLSLLGRQCIDGTLNGNRLEYEINAWSKEDKTVKDFVYSVYKKRFHYLMKLLSGIYQDKNLVKKHALILYSLVVGVDFFYRQLNREELELIFSDYLL
ncbi:MAG TPA: TetR/AcrR family transcriptional regulator [Oceanospirillales bacterium]|nr:TetR/AcrR family transcriptional regulator [Oceanospirillales bacterium]